MLYFDYFANQFYYFDSVESVPLNYYPVIVSDGHLYIVYDGILTPISDDLVDDIPDELVEEIIVNDDVSLSDNNSIYLSVIMLILFFLFLFTFLSRLGDYK